MIATFVAINVTVYAAMALQAVFHVFRQGFSGRGVVYALESPLSDSRNFGWELLLSAEKMAEHGQWWRAATASIVHLDAAHIAFNMLAIYFIGQAVEQRFGHRITAGMILASAGVGAFACLTLQPEATMGGASTVGYGLLAMLLGMKIAEREQMASAIVMVLIYFAWTIYTPGVSLWGHVGGFLGGSTTYFVVRGLFGPTTGPVPDPISAPTQVRRAETGALIIGAAALIAAGAVGVIN